MTIWEECGGNPHVCFRVLTSNYPEKNEKHQPGEPDFQQRFEPDTTQI
jgi:hypothetical protein